MAINRISCHFLNSNFSDQCTDKLIKEIVHFKIKQVYLVLSKTKEVKKNLNPMNPRVISAGKFQNVVFSSKMGSWRINLVPAKGTFIIKLAEINLQLNS